MTKSYTRNKAAVPSRTAVICIDMQNGECGAALRAETIRKGTDSRHIYLFNKLESSVIPNQQRLLEACRNAGIEIIYTTIESLTLDGRDRSLDYKISDLHFPRGSMEARVIDEIAPGADDIVLPKTTSSVFNSTVIDYILHNLGIEYLVIFGIITEQCVESAIRDAADRGYLVTQIEDCCASYSPETHETSIMAMKDHYCRTLKTGEFIEELKLTDTEN